MLCGRLRGIQLQAVIDQCLNVGLQLRCLIAKIRDICRFLVDCIQRRPGVLEFFLDRSKFGARSLVANEDPLG